MTWIDPYWYGVDLDGTLAYYVGWVDKTHIGYPVYRMWQRVMNWLEAGVGVRIVTARANDEESVQAIELWCLTYLGVKLPVTACKDYGMIELWDDRAVRVRHNTGDPYGPHRG